MHQSINIHTREFCFGSTATDGLMFLQRRGCSAHMEYGNSQHQFYVIRYPDQKWEVAFGHDRFNFTPEQGQAAVEQLIAEKTGVELKFGKEIMGYCYASAGGSNEQQDLFLSPLRYEEATDTIRHFPSNVCVVAFTEQRFAKPILDVDRAATPYLGAVNRALKEGFHSCDTQKGDDYCKRRLAWLAGRFLIKESLETTMPVAVLARDMSSPARIRTA